MIHPPDDRVSLLPFRGEFRRYGLATFRLDLQSGITVAIFAVPQAMAYAILAGLPPVHGLYAAVVMSMVAALWGSSPFVNTGPTNSAALLTAASVLPFLQGPRVLCVHRGSRHIQHLHIHPRFTPDDQQVLFTADPRGYGHLFLAEVPPFAELPTLEQVSTRAPSV